MLVLILWTEIYMSNQISRFFIVSITFLLVPVMAQGWVQYDKCFTSLSYFSTYFTSLCEWNKCKIYKVAKSHGLVVRLTYIYLFSQCHGGSYFSHRFLHGTHSSFRSNASVIQKLSWLWYSMLDTFHSTALFVITTCPDMLRNSQRQRRVPGMRSSVFIWVFF